MINLGITRELSATVPAGLLTHADRVIECMGH
jgi:hypothetical protein